jgi:proteic killer suppression protein
MILSFGTKDTQKIWDGEKVKKIPNEIQEIGSPESRMLNNSQHLSDLQIPSWNKLEKLKDSL